MYSGFRTLLPYAAATLSGSDVACAGAPLVLPGAGFFSCAPASVRGVACRDSVPH